MKLSAVLVACNENTKYLDFWPVVKKAWWELCGLPCIMVYVGKELPEHLKGDPAVKLFQPISSWPTATQAQVIRLLYPALLKCEGAVMLSDMDMIPMQKEFFFQGFEKFQPNQFVSLRGIDEPGKQIYICYVGATPKVWSDIFNIHNEEDIRKQMIQWSQISQSDGQHGGLGWCTDQMILYQKVKSFSEDRVGLIPWTYEADREDRLDRGRPYEWLQWNFVLEEKLKNRFYVDFHMPPYSVFKEIIDKVLDYLLK